MNTTTAPALVLLLCLGAQHASAGAPPPVAPAVEVRAGSDIVFLSGKTAPVVDTTAGKDTQAAYGSLHTQTLGVLGRIETELAARHLSMRNIVKVQVFLVKDEARYGAIDYAEFASAYAQFFGSPAARRQLPSRSTVLIAGLLTPGQLVEIEVTAVRRNAVRDSP